MVIDTVVVDDIMVLLCHVILQRLRDQSVEYLYEEPMLQSLVVIGNMVLKMVLICHVISQDT